MADIFISAEYNFCSVIFWEISVYEYYSYILNKKNSSQGLKFKT